MDVVCTEGSFPYGKGAYGMCQYEHITTDKLPLSERPYEKCEQYGAAYLTDAELLAVVIRTGTIKERASDLASRVLMSSPDGTLAGLNRLTVSELTKIHGIGRVKAVQIQCVLELAKRIARSTRDERICFSSPEVVAEYYMQQLRLDMTEKVFMLALDTKCNLIREVALSAGTFNASLLAPREVFYEALKHGAVYIIVIHNHPSGDPAPSRQDIEVTQRIADTGKLVGIELADHVIIGDNCYTSMREAGYLPSGQETGT